MSIENNFFEALDIASELAYLEGYSKEEFLISPERYLELFHSEIEEILDFRYSTRCLETKDILNARYNSFKNKEKFTYDLIGVDADNESIKVLAIVEHREQLFSHIEKHKKDFSSLLVHMPVVNKGYIIQGDLEVAQKVLNTLIFLHEGA